jgi:hypothetical protein
MCNECSHFFWPNGEKSFVPAYEIYIHCACCDGEHRLVMKVHLAHGSPSNLVHAFPIESPRASPRNSDPTDARQFAGSESSFLKTQLASGFIINPAGR